MRVGPDDPGLDVVAEPSAVNANHRVSPVPDGVVGHVELAGRDPAGPGWEVWCQSNRHIDADLGQSRLDVFAGDTHVGHPRQHVE